MRTLLADHLALLLTTIAATTVVAKIWAVAHGDPEGVTALVSSGGLTSLVGALLTGLPAVGIACLFAVGVFIPEAIREGDALRGPVVGSTAALIAALVLAPARWFLVGLVLIVSSIGVSLLVVAIRQLWKRNSSRRLPFILRQSERPQNVRPVASLVFVALLAWIAVATSDRPWLPVEDVTTTRSETITGYVLDESYGLLLMKESDRTVLRIPDEEVSRRVICSTDTRSSRSLMSKLFWRGSLAHPLCSDR